MASDGEPASRTFSAGVTPARATTQRIPIEAESSLPADEESVADSEGQATPAAEDALPLSGEPGLDARARRLRDEEEMLEREVRILHLRDELDTLTRRRNAGVTPARRARGPAGDEETEYTVSRAVANKPRLKEPDPFKGKTLKEAREFIRSLELVFALSGEVYQRDREKVLYGVMFLAGEPRETWHHEHEVGGFEDYSWAEFKSFVLDSVEDPVNRALSVAIAYDTAKQGDSQTAQAFATELATLEEQVEPYTEAQRTRHLLAKLKPALRRAIISYHNVPTTRSELISLATRLESADGKSSATERSQSRKRTAAEDRGRPASRKRLNATTQPSAGVSQAEPMLGRSATDKDRCWNCEGYGHFSRDCPKRNDRAKPATRKVTAGRRRSKKSGALADASSVKEGAES